MTSVLTTYLGCGLHLVCKKLLVERINFEMAILEKIFVLGTKKGVEINDSIIHL